MPLDINLFRADRPGGDPDKIRESQRRRYASEELVDQVIEADNAWRAAQGAVDSRRKDKGDLQKELTKIYKAKQKPSEEMMAQKEAIDRDVAELEKAVAPLAEVRDKLLAQVGNIVAEDVPTSNDEDADNDAFIHWPAPPGQGWTPPSKPIPHHQLLYMIGGYEPSRGAKVAGHKGYFLSDAGVLLNQAIINYAIALARARGFSLLQPPYMMNKEVMAGVAQLSEFDEALYKVTGEENSEQYLIATSEQPICGFHSGEWMQEAQLPLKYCGLSMCFRKEAGAHGRDVWGIFRVHQFQKVEQFVVTDGDFETSNAMQREMLANAEEMYQNLEIPYRVVNIVSGELNNAAVKKYDLEGYFPASYKAYRELVSCSNCTDYQSRAMEVRCGTKKDGQREKKYVHMLNSTLAAATRTLCIILENYQDGSGVRVPDALIPFMGGMTFLPFVRHGIKEWEGCPKKSSVQISPNAFTAAVAAANGSIPPSVPPAQEQKQNGTGKQKDKPAAAEKKAASKPAEQAPAAPVAASAPAAAAAPSKEETGPKMNGTPARTASAAPSLGAWEKLDAFLLKYPYCGGWTPTRKDVDMLEAVSGVNIPGMEEKYMNIFRWLRHIGSFSAAEQASW